MQTFLPYPSFIESAKVLDWRRLGKQRVECKQIYNALTMPKYGWQNHPAVKMWRGHEAILAIYGMTVCLEWRDRGYKDSLLPWFVSRMPLDYWPFPAWIGDETVHASHRSNLLRKDPEWYGKFNWAEKPDLPYIWPKV